MALYTSNLPFLARSYTASIRCGFVSRHQILQLLGVNPRRQSAGEHVHLT